MKKFIAYNEKYVKFLDFFIFLFLSKELGEVFFFRKLLCSNWYHCDAYQLFGWPIIMKGYQETWICIRD